MIEATLELDGAQLRTSLLQAQPPRADSLTAVILHGAGESSSERHEGLSKLFADHGISVVSLDFVGHGKTGGKMKNSSLALRTRYARAAIEHWTAPETPLILCGFSMGGHSVLRLLPQLGMRIHSVGLFCPATYAVEAESVPFGPEFTKILRTSESWRSSLGLKDAAGFTGKVAIVMGSQDEVIPWEVITEISSSLKQSAAEVRLEIIGGVGHQLARWLSEHKEFGTQLVHYLAA